MINTVLFDMGGTLENILIDEDSRVAAVKDVARILKSHGISVSDDIPGLRKKLDAGWERYNAYRDVHFRELKPEEIWGDYILTDLGLDFKAVEPFAEELAHSWEITYYKRSLREGVPEMLEGLKKMGYKLGIISNTASLFQVFRVLENYGIRDYFRDVTLSSVTGYRKPHPNIFLVSLNQIQSKASECAYVGDTYSRDVVGPQKVGFGMTFHITSFLTQMKDAGIEKDIRPTWSIENIYDVYTILKEQAGK
jgi:putative hydrolase of the HAD superfamily